MKAKKLKLPFLLTLIIVVLASIASAGGLFLEQLYRDNTFIRAAWRGNYVVTLFVVVPVMVTA